MFLPLNAAASSGEAQNLLQHKFRALCNGRRPPRSLWVSSLLMSRVLPTLHFASAYLDPRTFPTLRWLRLAVDWDLKLNTTMPYALILSPMAQLARKPMCLYSLCTFLKPTILRRGSQSRTRRWSSPVPEVLCWVTRWRTLFFAWSSLELCIVFTRPLQDQQLRLRLPSATFVDDAVFVVFDHSATLLIAKIRCTLDIVQHHCEFHGFRPDFSVGKTELLLRLRGLNYAQAKTLCAPRLIQCERAQLRIVRSHKHLGHIVTNKLGRGPDVKRRVRTTLAVYVPLAARIFRCSSIPLAYRAQVANAMLVSIACHGAGLWHELPQHLGT